MASNSEAQSGGIGVGGVLLCIFVTLKLLHKIDWSWWWVLSPIWIPLLIVAALFIVFGIFATVVAFLDR